MMRFQKCNETKYFVAMATSNLNKLCLCCLYLKLVAACQQENKKRNKALIQANLPMIYYPKNNNKIIFQKFHLRIFYSAINKVQVNFETKLLTEVLLSVQLYETCKHIK